MEMNHPELFHQINRCNLTAFFTKMNVKSYSYKINMFLQLNFIFYSTIF